MIFKNKLTPVAFHAHRAALDLYTSCHASLSELEMRIEECEVFDHDSVSLMALETKFSELSRIVGRFMTDLSDAKEHIQKQRYWLPNKGTQDQANYYIAAEQEARRLLNDYFMLREQMQQEVTKLKIAIKKG